MFVTTTGFVGPRVGSDSIYGLLHRECFELFPDGMFADLFTDVGRRWVPPMIVAVVMVLQRLEGCSDREAVDRFAYDLRWKYACGGLDFDYPGFVHTVLVDMRARLRLSGDPDRIFNVTLDAARQAGLVGRRRVLDSTCLFDAVATMDTVTLIRSAVRGVLGACGADWEPQLRGVLGRDDEYRTAGKPACDWDDRAAREELVDALARDAYALLGVLDGHELGPVLEKAAQLLATVVGQDLEAGEDGVFRIARRVAKDRVISTVDTDARHGHKTSAHGFDGYKGHVAVDPDCELILATSVTAGNVGDAAAVTDLLADDLPPTIAQTAQTAETMTIEEPLEVYGDSAYGTGAVLDSLEAAGAVAYLKTQPARAPGGRFPKTDFGIDLDAHMVSCPAGHTVAARPVKDGHTARFGKLCTGCPLAERCTASTKRRSIHLGIHERQLTAARARQTDPAWKTSYTGTRPKVERKIAHLMFRKHGGRRARVRGHTKVAADFALLSAAVNLARLGLLGLARQPDGWTLQSA
jgi:hypothetical protein